MQQPLAQSVAVVHGSRHPAYSGPVEVTQMSPSQHVATSGSHIVPTPLHLPAEPVVPPEADAPPAVEPPLPAVPG